MTPTFKENMTKVFNHEVADWVPHFYGEVDQIIDDFIERPLLVDGIDAWGTKWLSCPAALGMTNPDVNDIKYNELDNWRSKVQIPQIDNVDFTAVIQSVRLFDRNEKMLLYVSLNGIFERSHALMGFENALVAAIEEPDEFSEMLAAFTEHKIRVMKKMYEYAQPDIYLYHDDMANQKSPFFHTDFYVQYIFPHYKKIVQAAKEIGYKYVFHHSCGMIEDLIPAWLECGFDGWESVMPCNDLPEIKRKYGKRIVFISGLDAQEILGPENTKREKIEKMVLHYLNTMAYDGTGFCFNNNFIYSLNPANEEICNMFIKKHQKAFIDAIKAGREYLHVMEVVK